MAWFIVVEGQRLGPLSDPDVMAWAQSGRMKPSDLVWQEGMPEWVPAGQVPQISQFLGYAATPQAASGDDAVMRVLLPVGRSGWAIAAGYLGLFSLLVVPGPFAVICGILAIRDIRRNPQKHGMGRAIFGIVLGGVGTLVLGFLLVSALLPGA